MKQRFRLFAAFVLVGAVAGKPDSLSVCFVED